MVMSTCIKSFEYRGKVALAPMVRVNILPMRLLCLKYGADLVWGPEIVDRALMMLKREPDEKLNTINFMLHSDSKPPKILFQTLPEMEKDKLVFQLGSSDPEYAVKASKVIVDDVKAIDLNCGCPKPFATHSGGGAKLLTNPDRLISILDALVEEIGKPHDISISAKIRVLSSKDDTLNLVNRIVRTGVKNLTVHCRTPSMRTREPPIRDFLGDIADICHEQNVCCLINGGVKHRDELQSLIDQYKIDGAMISTAAQKSPSCFHKTSINLDKEEDLKDTTIDLDWRDIVKTYVDYCHLYDSPVGIVKLNIGRLIPETKVRQKVNELKRLEEIQNYINSLATQ